VLLTGICQPNTPLFIIQDHTPCSSSSVCTVEGFAIHHYTGTGCWPRALHLEGAIFTSLFLLLFWDIIYTNEVPDVFRGHYQTAPLDFGREDFYMSRKSAIDSKLDWIKRSAIDLMLFS
ncbi:PREDICTED: fanconi-associated nuclease 1 homolog, partial [Amphimedon queenslandica]|uniref:Fanconi-associated nuclease n=1 Tax=Amphimedon queenslandica TaxID=400682 RepID=A0A1X7SMV8_AMPQE